MMPLFVYFYILVHSFIPSHSSVAIRRGSLHLLIASKLSGKTSQGAEPRIELWPVLHEALH
jgi:hypothetical protein